MNAQILFLVAAIGGTPVASEQPAHFFSISDAGAAIGSPFIATPANWLGRADTVGFVVRGQNGPYAQNSQYDEDPNQSVPPSTYAVPSYGAPYAAPPAGYPGGPWMSPFSQPVPQDPFLGQPGNDAWGGPFFGAHGPQPFRFGWTSRFDVGYIPGVSSNGAVDHFSVFETDVELKYTSSISPSFITSIAPQFGYRAWDGPDNTTPQPLYPQGSSLPGSVYRFGADLVLQTPGNMPWSAMIAFNPSLNTDFDAKVEDDAINWDGRGMIFFRYSPQWMFAGGAGYLDRVHDRVIPYAGFVFTPNDRWEFRIMYPESRVSYFLGNYWGYSQWLYARGEYHIEAYQVSNELAGVRDQVELEDYRILIGLRTEIAGVSTYAEAGWVFARDIDFKVTQASFDPRTAFIMRLGLRY